MIHHPSLVNIYTDDIGIGTSIGPFVEIQAGAKVGRDCKIQSHSFICAGVTIGDRVFIGHGVMFSNDKHPTVSEGWDMEYTVVEDDVSIGSGSVILPVRLGRGCFIGAGAVVTHDVLPGQTVMGIPAR
jgi:acetyltransferase-like isoleucine patch superfamily enzyme